jgi:hypothetical protein
VANFVCEIDLTFRKRKPVSLFLRKYEIDLIDLKTGRTILNRVAARMSPLSRSPITGTQGTTKC